MPARIAIPSGHSKPSRKSKTEDFYSKTSAFKALHVVSWSPVLAQHLVPYLPKSCGSQV
jgi:hypothetical protein